MKYILSVITLSAFCFQINCCLSITDFIPVKFDVLKVRSEKELKAHKGRHTALDFIGLVERHRGYTAEEHTVKTPDGYHLKLHRITGSPRSQKAWNKPVIFFQHCMFSSSDSYVMFGPSHDLAYLLADRGYDVWFGNSRGNTYSRSHSSYSPNMEAFWNFSWHEIGTIDVPTTIDYILKLTQRPQLTFIGFSMGTTVSYVLLSKLPEYNQKINLVISLAPTAYWKEVPFLMKYGIQRITEMTEFSKKYHVFELLPQSEFLINLIKIVCLSGLKIPSQIKPCSLLLNTFYPLIGVERTEFTVPNFLNYFFASASLKTMFHYLQNANKGDFQEYDFGPQINWMKYGQTKPPSYDLARVTAPVALVYGPRDFFGTPNNTEIIKKKLPNVVYDQIVPNELFTHIDFLLAKNLKSLVWDNIIPVIDYYHKN